MVVKMENVWEYQELINLLSSDKISDKQFAILELTEIRSMEDAQKLVYNLVGQDGKVREACAHKINELTQNDNYINYFLDITIYKTLLQGILDVNGNVCRQIINSRITEDESFRQYLYEKLPERITKILTQIEETNALSDNFKQKKYETAKQNFQLYWCLEALYLCARRIEVEKLQKILFKTGTFSDYTIREKTAKVLTKIDNPLFDELKIKLSKDENYYVRRFLTEEDA